MTTDTTRTPEPSTVDHRRTAPPPPAAVAGPDDLGPPAAEPPFTLLDADERHELREHWDRLQTGFVDDPQATTHAADALLDETLDRIASRWQDHHRSLRQRWSAEDVSTEELRTALRRYRDAFERLITA